MILQPFSTPIKNSSFHFDFVYSTSLIRLAELGIWLTFCALPSSGTKPENKLLFNGFARNVGLPLAPWSSPTFAWKSESLRNVHSGQRVYLIGCILVHTHRQLWCVYSNLQKKVYACVFNRVYIGTYTSIVCILKCTKKGEKYTDFAICVCTCDFMGVQKQPHTYMSIAQVTGLLKKKGKIQQRFN